MNVVVIGASNKPNRYSYKAIEKLKGAGHKVFPVHPKLTEIQGLKVFNQLAQIDGEINTVSLYVSKERSDKLASGILDMKPKRIIFNPGAENDALMLKADALGIKVMEACTIILVNTKQF
jgi:uncharacterized protein